MCLLLFWWMVGAFSQSSPLCTGAFLTLKTRYSALLRWPALGWVSSGVLLLSLLNHTWLMCQHESQTPLHALIFLPAGLLCGFLAWGCSVCMLSHFSHVWLFATLWTVAYQAPLSMGFSRQEYWGGLPCTPPGDLPDPEKVAGIEPASLMSPALASEFFTTTATWKLEWVAIPFSSRSSQPGIEPRSPALQVDSLPSKPPQEPSNRWQKQAWETETCPAAPGGSVSSCHWERKNPGWSTWSEAEFFCLVLSGILTEGEQNTCQAGQSTQDTEERWRSYPALKDLTVNWTDRGSISQEEEIVSSPLMGVQPWEAKPRG